MLREGPKATWTDHWGNALVVHIDEDHSWGLNSEKFSRTELRRALEERLCRRAEKIVIFEGRSNIAFSEAAEAIDVIQSACPTAVALLTPNSKKVGFERLYLPIPHNDSHRALPESAIPEALR